MKRLWNLWWRDQSAKWCIKTYPEKDNWAAVTHSLLSHNRHIHAMSGRPLIKTNVVELDSFRITKRYIKIHSLNILIRDCFNERSYWKKDTRKFLFGKFLHIYFYCDIWNTYVASREDSDSSLTVRQSVCFVHLDSTKSSLGWTVA